MEISEYRSPGIVRGHFRQLGGVHLHVDGGEEYEFALSLLKRTEREFPGKVTVISNSVGGPQRQRLQNVYASHTPGSGEAEDFECFLTMDLGSRDGGLRILRKIIRDLSNRHGSVVEVECLIGRIEDGKHWEAIPATSIMPIRGEEVGFEPSATMAIELHHGLDFSLDCAVPSLGAILYASIELGLDVGGWFEFKRPEGVSFRSNAFHETDGIQDKAEVEHELLRGYLEGLGHPFKLWSSVESVLGIWKSPFHELRKLDSTDQSK
jgi:hypothetical protein